MDYKDKPISMSIRDFLIKKISIDKKRSPEEIFKIISFQFDEASLATETCNSIELSGFGKFMFNEKKANKQMIKYNQQVALFTKKIESSTSENEIRVLNLKLKTTENNINHLKPKLCQS